MAVADTVKLLAVLGLKDEFSGPARKITKSIDGIDARIKKTDSIGTKIGKNIGTGIKATAALAASAVTATAGVVAASVKLAGDFEAQLNTINTIAQKSPAELGKIGDSIRGIARTTGTSLDDLTGGYYDLLSAGIKAADAQNVLTQANKLAIGGLSTTSEAIDLLTTAINSYGGDASKAALITDQFAEAIAAGKTTAADMAASFAQVGPLAAKAGIGLDEIAASLGVMTATGTGTAEAMTQIRAAITLLQKPTSALKKLMKETGIDFEAIAKKKGLAFAFNEMEKAAKKAGIPMAQLTGRIEASLFSAQVAGDQFGKYTAELDKVHHASDGAGVAAEQMAQRQKGLNFQLGILKANAKDAAITIGSELLPKITPLVQRLNDFLQSAGAQNALKKFADNVAGLFSDKNIQSGIDAIKTGFETVKAAAPILEGSAKATLSIVQAAVGLFKSLPAPLQQLAVGAFAVNKLTGGLVTNIVGGIGDFLIKQRGATPANPLFVADVTGGVGGLLGGAGAAAGAGEAAAAAGGLGLGTIAAGVAAGTAVAALGIMGLGWLITATSTPDQLATSAQNAIDQNRLKHGLGGVPTKTGPLTGPAGNVTPNFSRLAFDLGKVGNLTPQFSRLAADFGAVGTLLKGMPRQLESVMRSGLIAVLAKANKPADVAKATAAAVKEFVTRKQGNLDQTQKLLAGLEAKLKTTHDPKTAAILRAAIHDVQTKLPPRQLAVTAVAKADGILKSNRSTGDKIKALQAIEKDLKDHKLPGATRKVEEKISALRRSQAEAQHATTQAIKDKDMSPTINVPVVANSYITTNGITSAFHFAAALGSGRRFQG